MSLLLLFCYCRLFVVFATRSGTMAAAVPHREPHQVAAAAESKLFISVRVKPQTDSDTDTFGLQSGLVRCF